MRTSLVTAAALAATLAAAPLHAQRASADPFYQVTPYAVSERRRGVVTALRLRLSTLPAPRAGTAPASIASAFQASEARG